MLISDMDIERLVIHVHEVEENKLREREEFRNNKAKTSGNESRLDKSNANQLSFKQNQKGLAPSSASAPGTINNFRCRPV